MHRGLIAPIQDLCATCAIEQGTSATAAEGGASDRFAPEATDHHKSNINCTVHQCYLELG